MGGLVITGLGYWGEGPTAVLKGGLGAGSARGQGRSTPPNWLHAHFSLSVPLLCLVLGWGNYQAEKGESPKGDVDAVRLAFKELF